LLLGLAFACNFGGLMTPISSLQNLIAVSQLQTVGVNVNFFSWMLISVPFSIIGTILSWLLINFVTHKDETIRRIPVVVVDLESKLFTTKNIVIMSTSLLACFLFAGFGLFSEYLGDIGIVSLCYMVFMFGSGILTDVDFHALRWQSIMLLGGGSVLGKAVETSGLLQLITDGIISGGSTCFYINHNVVQLL
jgi:phosphate transporter